MSDLTIHAALSPRVAILASADVRNVISPNGLTDLAALLRPFQASVSQLNVRTSQLEQRTCQQFPIRFDDISTFTAPTTPLHSASPTTTTPTTTTTPYTQSHPSPEETLDLVSAHISANANTWLAHIHAANPQPADDQHALLTRATQKLETATPWFIHFRDTILHQRPLTRHHTFNHPVALLLAVSSASPDPMNDFARLYESASANNPFQHHPYIDPNCLTYYLLLHDVHTSGSDLSQSLEVLDHVKRTYGLHCCLLPINSAEQPGSQRSPEVDHMWTSAARAHPEQAPAAAAPPPETAPTPAPPPITTARLLDDEDVRRLKGFVRELTAQSIVPFMERCVQQWNEQLAASRKGITGRLFGASRKFFGSAAAKAASSASPLSSSPGYNVQHDFYHHSSVEAQTRRLADFAFTIRDYKLAAAMYDLGRKDFAGDKAWRHSAAANEMFGLAHLMAMYVARTPAPIDVDGYLSQACYEYALKPANDHAALRATLLYYEVYRALDHFRPAPAALQRMAHGSDEVFSALLLEQAALSDLKRKPRPALRKCALHIVMAAHRYQACGQKALSLRCYAQAAALYRDKSWTLVENHLERELGMQAYNGGDADAAVAHLSKLLRPGQCSAEEHETSLKDLLTAFKYAGAQGSSGDGSGGSSSKPPIRLQRPMFDPRHARIRITGGAAGHDGVTVSDAVWAGLEDEFMESGFTQATSSSLAASANGDSKVTARKRPATLLSSRDNRAAIGATFWLDAVVENPLNTTINIKHIRPHLRPDSKAATAKTVVDDAVGHPQAASESRYDAEAIGPLILGPRQLRSVSLPIRIQEAGVHRVTHVSFVLADELPVCESLEAKRGRRLASTREQRLAPAYAADETLRLTVHEAESESALLTGMASPPTSMLLGEECRVELVLHNVSAGEVSDVRALCSSPGSAVFLHGTDGGKQGMATTAVSTSTTYTVSNDLRASAIQPLVGVDEKLVSGEERTFTVVLRATQLGPVDLAWLFVFADAEGRFHAARLSHHVDVEPSLDVSVHSRPVAGLACDYRLAIQAINASDRETLSVVGVSFVAPHWRTTDGVEQGSTGRDARTTTTLEPCQTLRLSSILTRTQDEGDADAGSLAFTVGRLRTMLQNREVDAKVGPPPTRLYASGSSSPASTTDEPPPHRRLLLRHSRLLWRRRMLSSHFATLSETDRLNAFLLYEPNDVDVIVHWQTISTSSSSSSLGNAARQRIGSIYIAGLVLGPCRNQLRALDPSSSSGAVEDGAGIRSMYAETTKERATMLQNLLTSRLALDEEPLIVDAHFKEHTTTEQRASVFDGQEGKTLPVEITIRNFSEELQVDFLIHLGDGGDGGDAHIDDDLTRRTKVEWIGRRTIRGTLLPRSSVVIERKVRVEGRDKGEGRMNFEGWTVGMTCFIPGQKDGGE